MKYREEWIAAQSDMNATTPGADLLFTSEATVRPVWMQSLSGSCKPLGQIWTVKAKIRGQPRSLDEPESAAEGMRRICSATGLLCPARQYRQSRSIGRSSRISSGLSLQWLQARLQITSGLGLQRLQARLQISSGLGLQRVWTGCPPSIDPGLRSVSVSLWTRA